MATATLVPAASVGTLSLNLGLHARRFINALMVSRAFSAERMLRPHGDTLKELASRHGRASMNLTPDAFLPFKL
ncbi:hypothetical protein [Microvirga puerhi]|uniref:Uncharacterized protein n=1 Tax=Microvirga puerhi TaxID=2876078 RepID=A0ABS7VJG9_9HYPH|nr:hypothetical protein [Microvirga puerhi]MBZ6075240.1 hypothetical protein [Microvirga puerhi]